MCHDVPVAAEVDELSSPWAVPRMAGPLELSEPAWELFYGVVYALCLAIAEAGSLSHTGRILVTVALAAMLPWYLLVGRPLMMLAASAWEEVQASRRGPVYLTGLVVLFGVAQSQNTDVWFLAFALIGQCFQVTSMRRGMVFVVILNVLAGVLLLIRSPGLENGLSAVGIAVFAIVFAYVFSRFTMRVLEQSRERAILIEELTATRNELAAAHHEAGVAAERHRLAGEIHDTLTQGFTSVVALTQAAQACLDPAATEARRLLGLTLDTAKVNLAEARALIAALSPAGLESSSLGDALYRITQVTEAETGVVAAASVAGDPRPLPTGTEVVLLRVCQEALANVRKHAAASTVAVRLDYAEDAVRLEVADDGAGFDVAAVNSGYGLRGMRERLSQVGGTVRVRSAPGSGTTVHAEVPL